MEYNTLINYERKLYKQQKKIKVKNRKCMRTKQNDVQLTLLGLRDGGPSLSVEIPIAARI